MHLYTPSVDIGIALDAFFVFEGLSLWKGTEMLRKFEISSRIGEEEEINRELELLWHETRKKENCPSLKEQAAFMLKSILKRLKILCLKLRKQAIVSFFKTVELLNRINNTLPILSCLIASIAILLYYSGHIPSALIIPKTLFVNIVASYVLLRTAIFLIVIIAQKTLYRQTSIRIKDSVLDIFCNDAQSTI